MQEKYTVLIARIISGILPPNVRAEIAEHFADEFRKEFSGFNRDWFLQACNVPTPTGTGAQAVEWKEITRERYDEYLGCVPPVWRTFSHDGFCVGEPSDHNESGRPRYQGCKIVHGKCYASVQPVTVNEFLGITGNDVLANVAAA